MLFDASGERFARGFPRRRARDELPDFRDAPECLLPFALEPRALRIERLKPLLVRCLGAERVRYLVGNLLPLAAFALALALAPPLSSGAAEGGPPRFVRIMPLGDSITEGTSGDATWRYWLQKSLESNGCVVDFVGSRRGVRYGQARFSDFDPDHEGHWGWRISQVKAEIDRWASDAKPEIVLLHLGTNDLGSDPERIAAGLGAIVTSLRRANPAVEIYLARLIPAAGVPDEVMRRTNDAIARSGAEQDRPESPPDRRRSVHGLRAAGRHLRRRASQRVGREEDGPPLVRGTARTARLPAIRRGLNRPTAYIGLERVETESTQRLDSGRWYFRLYGPL